MPQHYRWGQLDPENCPLFSIILGLIIPTWSLLTTHLTRREIPYLLQPVKPTPRLQFTVLLHQIRLRFAARTYVVCLLPSCCSAESPTSMGCSKST